MFKTLSVNMRRHWGITLAVFTGLLFVFNVAIFYPGFMSNDSLSQLGQATGRYPLSDLTPPAMVILWRALITVTNHTSSMLVIQLTLLWGALGALSLYVYDISKSKARSLLALTIGLMPVVINISGVIWRDNQMAFSLLSSVVLVLWAGRARTRGKKNFLYISALLLVGYACLTRYNAIIAAIPLIVLVVRAWLPMISILTKGFIVLGIAFTMLALTPLINWASHAQPTNAVSAAMLDDIVNLASDGDIEMIPQPRLRASLSEIKKCAISKGLLVNNFWICASDKDRKVIQYTEYAAVRSQWLKTVINSPAGYIMYKAEGFAVFLFPPEHYVTVWQNGIEPNDQGQNVKVERLGNVVGVTITNFWNRHWSFIFETWFWLIICGVLMWAATTSIQHKSVIMMLGLSGTIYILGYFPTGATGDYRYIYWPVLAGLTGGVLLISERSRVMVTKLSTRHEKGYSAANSKHL